MEVYFKECGFSKSEGSTVNCELKVVTLFLRRKFMICDFWLMEESSIDFFFFLRGVVFKPCVLTILGLFHSLSIL